MNIKKFEKDFKDSVNAVGKTYRALYDLATNKTVKRMKEIASESKAFNESEVDIYLIHESLQLFLKLKNQLRKLEKHMVK